MLQQLQIDEKAVTEQVAAFISSEIAEAGLNGGVIALSGGIDSAVTAYLSVRALGDEDLRTYNMPYRTSNPSSKEHARLVAAELGVPFEVIDISPQIDAYFDRFPQADRLRRANKMARERMSIIYDMGKLHHAMVIGTGNRTEALLGYTTIWGDMACGIAPIGNLYKAQVRQLAEFLGVPPEIIQKPPSADLWVGQTDEAELGMTYAQADVVLYHLVDLQKSPEIIIKKGFDESVVKTVADLVRRNAFKRCLPPACRISMGQSP